ncbi:flavin reductase family protein [Deinococcus deserti]|uniref:Putative flavoredoxin n=1 Tax=Deinococcus deserti (strain DSM 17065 / CIP 109153 / LMG 22923 / VCD115) TaxID=546414 RepID=C1D215_DEIDV|nr:flavin reductase family protein [Deinococcus deserti]ACO47454.1 putative flavoredoxin [Deinococcus deserti VCD115]
MLSARTARFFGYYPGTVALVTAEHSGTRNVLSVGWHTALSADPPLYGVAVGRERGSHPLIVQSGHFGVNFLPFAAAQAVQGAGVLSLHDAPQFDKLARLGLTTLPGSPLAVTQAYLHYRCEVVDVVRTGDHDLFVGRVSDVHFDPAHYDAEGLFAGEAAVYLGRSAYVTTTRERQVFLPGDFA